MRFLATASLSITLFVSTVIAADDILNDYPAYGPLPTVIQAEIKVDGQETFTNTTQTAEGALDLNNIQGDVLVGMRKDKELFSFFHIDNPASFKTKMQSDIAALITSTAQLLSPQFDSPFAVNLAFSASGLTALQVVGDVGDNVFKNGQFKDASNLGDPGTGAWLDAFKGTNINGVFLIASNNWDVVDNTKAQIANILGSDVTVVHELRGEARPPPFAGHEHFGFMDGISQPGITGFTTDFLPGQVPIPAGEFILGETGDNRAASRPSWAKDGTIMAFRQLQQLVPEFDKFVADQAAANNMTADLLGARMVGRWKSGAPIDLAPTQDDPTLAADPRKNNDFTFAHPNEDLSSDQSRCPFSAHIRKTKPRADLNDTAHHIIRAGIPYGPEVSPEEAASGTTTQERGLAFVAYQSDLAAGFQFMQRLWANSPTFVFGKSDSTPGADPLIGQTGGARAVSGLVPGHPDTDITFPIQHVVSKGGEYFFAPSIAAITSGFTN